MGSSRYTIAVVGHDAGGAELLCAFIKAHLDQALWNLFALPDTPMAAIAAREGLPINAITNAAQQLQTIQPDLLLFSTGWQSHNERPFIAYAKAHGIPTVAFLDHWSHYRERFGYPDANWKTHLPDYTAVHDAYAFKRARELDLPHPLALPNYYLQNLVASTPKKAIRSQLLFLSEPTDTVAQAHYGNPNYWGFTQYSALEAILTAFHQFECQNLVIRLHPSEKEHAYEKLLRAYPHIPYTIHHSNNIPINEELMESQMIIGFDTMALYIAAHLHKPLISFLPSLTRDFLLPLPKTHQLRHLNDLRPFHLKPVALHHEDFGMNFADFVKIVGVLPPCNQS